MMRQFYFLPDKTGGFIKKLWLFACFLLFSWGANAQCPTGNVILTSQTQVNTFGTNYPNCTEITGYLYIGGSTITDLSPLSNIQSIGGLLEISYNSQLTNLDGLSNLTQIGGGLYIYNNSQLTNLDGLIALESINGYLRVQNNAVLTDISGLQNIDPATILPNSYGLYIQYNPLLSVCNLDNFCTYLAGSGPRNISGNAGNCYESAVTTACTTSQEPQCPTGDVGLYSQADVNNFATNYPNCTEITGYLQISGSDITDLSPLSNIQSIGGYLYIRDNNTLTNAVGLSSLTSIGEYLYIAHNNALTNLNGFSSLTTVGGYIQINNNNALTNVTGLSSLTSTGGNLLIYNHSQLTSIGLSSLTNIGGYLYIQSNSQLTNLDGLSNLTQIGGYLNISSNSQLTNLDGLSNLTEIGGYLDIYYNSQLTNLDGLSNLTQIGGFLQISVNSQLTNLDGLIALESINGDLLIYDNPVLTDISGLQNIDPATILPTNGYGLYIQYNPLLSVCNLDNFCTYLAGSGARTISNNAGDCVSVTAVTTACTTSQEPQCPTGNVELYSQADVNNFATNYPNCTEITGYLYIGGSNITDLSPLSNIQSIGGLLLIQNNYQLTNLDGLSNLTQIGGYLNIYNNSQLTNLDGLSNLTQIGGYLNISSNSQLTNLDGLSNLTSIGADLAIYSNSALTDISGLQNIDPNSILSTYYGEGLYITDNPLLSVCNLDNFCTYLAGSGPRTISQNAGDCVSVTAVTTACTASSEPQCPTGDVGLYSQADVNNFATNYPNCTEITGYLYISGSDITDLSPLSNIQSIGGYLDIYYNSQLTNLDGLSNLTEIGGYLNISSNSQLTNLDGLSNLTQIGGFLNIESNSQLTNLDGLSNLTQIGGYLDIYNNSQLTNLDGLSNLTQIGGLLEISYNSQLTNLDGLSNLTSIGADLAIYSNSALTDISGLQNIDPNSISTYYGVGLYIRNNPLLSVCNLDNFCTYLAGSGLRNISGNAGDCVSVTAVTTACTTSSEPQCPTGDVILTSQTQVNDFGTNYPNCTEITGNLQISGSNITDLSPLSNIQSVGGYLYAEHSSQLTSLQGLHNVASVGGSLSIYNNPQLNSVQALSNITSLGGFLSIYNTNLSSLEGLHNITAIDGGLSITSNAVLTDISALENIDPETITGTGLYIAGNSSLSVCDLDNFCTFLQGSGTRTISGNAGNCYESAVTDACLGVISYCIPTPYTDSGYYGINIYSFTTTGGETNINNTNSGFSTGGYGNFSDAHSASQNAGESLSFSAVPGNESYLKGLKIWVDWNNDGVFDNTDGNPEIVYVSPSVLAGTHNGSFTIPGNKPTGNYRMRVMMKYESTTIDPCEITNGTPYYGSFYGETEDYTLTVLEPLPCSSPTALTASNLTMESATIDWTSTGSLFEIEWGTAGFAQGNGTTDTTSATSYDLSGLDVGTSYDFYVRQDCNASSDGYSNWVKYTFSTNNYCIPVADANSGYYGIYINSFTVTGGETNINNTNSGFSTGGYGNFSAAYSASQIAGESLSFSAVPGTENYQKGLRIWVDWNKDGVFANDSSEIVYVSSNTLQGTHSSSFTIPSNKPAGNYRMRVMMIYYTNNFIPCQTGTFGETEDYTLTVLEGCNSYTIWNGTEWSNGTPDANKKAIIEGNLTLTENMTACELLLNSGVLTVTSGAVLTVNGQIVNTQSEADFIVQSGANLIQVADVENDGAITVQRSKMMKHLDYTIWSSPVLGQNLKAFSPLTLNNRIRIYDTTDDSWKVIANPETTDFVSGAGVMFRAPNADDNPGTPYLWTGSFKGIPQNGNVTYNFNNAYGNGIYQSVGNPYPSNIDSEVFFDFNTKVGTLYFWTNTNAYDGNDYIGYNWATINSAGDAVEAGNGVVVPNGIIPSGQGFVVETNGIIQEVSFNNQMRTANSGVFFRTMTYEKHRIWLDLSQENQSINQMLVGYSDNATNEFDFGIDSKLFNYSGSALYSLINNNDESYVIQNRSLPFDDNDIVPLGFRATQAGSFTVSLSNFDGLFAENQDIFIKDNFTNATHNLKNGSYTFVSENGTFDNRFELVYRESSMSVSNPDLNNNWIVYKQNDVFHIQTQGFDMKEITVYDMLGRTVYTSKADGNTHAFSKIGADQVLIVKVTTSENEVMNKKVTN